jgi:signal transduction histidine kinase
MNKVGGNVLGASRELWVCGLVLSVAGLLLSVPALALPVSSVAAGVGAGLPPALGAAGLGAIGLLLGLRVTTARPHPPRARRSAGRVAAGNTGGPGLSATGGDRLADLAGPLAEAAALGPGDSDALRWAALLHDAGLAAAAVEIAVGVEPVAQAEAWAGMLRKAPPAVRETDHSLQVALRSSARADLASVSGILAMHHERRDGRGHPCGLRGDEIPLPASLLGIAETYQVLTQARPSRPAPLTPREALGYLWSRVGEEFPAAALAALGQHVSGGAAGDASDDAPADAGYPLPDDIVRRAEMRLFRPADDSQFPLHPSLPGLGLRSLAYGERGGRPLRWGLLPGGPTRREKSAAAAADWYRDLFNLGRAFGSSLSAPLIGRQLAEAVYRLTSTPCAVHLVSGADLALVPAAVSGLPSVNSVDLSRATADSALGRALAGRRPVTALISAADPRSSLVVPMWVNDTPLGVISVNPFRARRFPLPEVQALTVLANLASLALYNAFIHAETRLKSERLAQSQMQLEAVVDTVPAAILIFSSSGLLVSANARAAAFLRDLGMNPPCSASGPAGTNLLETLTRKLGATAPAGALLRRVPCGPEAVTVQVKSGERHFEVWASPFGGAEGVCADLLVILDDVTRASRLAAEVHRTEKLALVGEVAARAAHEIRNPLTAIHGFGQLMSAYCPVRQGWPECPKYVGRIAGEIERLTTITDSMLCLARPVRSEMTIGNVADVIEETLVCLAGKAAERNVTLEHAPGPPLALAEFDARQLKQVLLNLIQNAIEAVSGEGGPPAGWRKVAVSAGYTRRDRRRHVFIQVRDNGPGLRSEDKPKLFTPFFTTKDTGTGLGLSIAKNIIAAHNGLLEFRPAAGRGTVFEILLPFCPSAIAEEAIALDQTAFKNRAGAGDSGGEAASSDGLDPSGGPAPNGNVSPKPPSKGR